MFRVLKGGEKKITDSDVQGKTSTFWSSVTVSRRKFVLEWRA